MPTMSIPTINYGVTIQNPQNDYSGLDANGNTPGDIACLADPNCDMTARLSELFNQDIAGTGAGSLPSGASLVSGLGTVPSWVWLVGGGALVFILMRRSG